MTKFEGFEIVNEDEETSFPQQKDESEESKANFENEVVILGRKLLCTDIYDLRGKASVEELHLVEIHTVTNRSMDSSAEDNRGLPGRKLTKSRSLGNVQRQKRKRENFSQKQQSFERTIGSTVNNVEQNELIVLTENLDSLDDRLPRILQANATKSCLNRKQGAQTLQTSTKEFLPSLNIKPPNLKEKMRVNGSQVSHLPALVCKQGLTTKTTPPLDESANESLSSTPNQENDATTFYDASPIIPRKKLLKNKTTPALDERANENLSSTPNQENDATTFSDVSPIIPRKKLLKNHGFSVIKGSPSSPRRPTPFPSICGEDCFFYDQNRK